MDRIRSISIKSALGDDPHHVTSSVDEGEDRYVKIGDGLNDSSDPRKLRGLQRQFGNGVRMRNLRFTDSKSWHYSVMVFLFLNLVVEVIAISFSTSHTYSPIIRELTRYVALVISIISSVDVCIRISGLRSAFLRSNSTVADLCFFIVLLGLLICKYLFTQIELDISIAYAVCLAARIILKPKARIFSLQLHSFSRRGTGIHVAMDAVRAALRRIPGVSAVVVEMMEMELVIICGRDVGDMCSDELMQFLERALLYRPRELSATEFLSHLQDIGAHSVQHAYGAFDVVRSTLWHWSSQKVDLVLSILVVCVNATVIPFQSYLIGYISDQALGSQHSKDALTLGVTGILLLCIPSVFGNCAIGYFQSKMIAKATERLQYMLLNTILSQPTKFFQDRSEGDLNNLFASDISRVNALWQSVFWNLLNPLVSVLAGFGFILFTDIPTGIVCFTFTAVLLSTGPQGIAAAKSKEFGSKNAYITAEFQNAIGCQKLIRAYDIRQPFMEHFSINISVLMQVAFLKDFWASIVQIYVESAMYIFVAIQTAALAMKAFHGDITPGEFFAFITMLSRISTPVTTLGGFMRVAIGNASSLQRLDDIIVGFDHEGGPDPTDAALPALPKMEKCIELKNLFFKYDKMGDSYVLQNLSASVQKGTYTCICGPSGSGKSTALSVLMQFFDPDSGTISLDSHDISLYSRTSFQQQTAVVFQDIMILNGTIMENIRYGCLTATDEDCIEAARLAECYTFITELRDGFNAIIGQHATCTLSGGQAQRICLARALCRRPRLLLLDEATSALDTETEASIIYTLEKLSKKYNMTIISVTHRLQTTVNADQILVLNKGQICEAGTYKALISSPSSVFADMIQSQDLSPLKNTCSCQNKTATRTMMNSHDMPLSSRIDDTDEGASEEHKRLLQIFSLYLTNQATASDREGTRRKDNRHSGYGHANSNINETDRRRANYTLGARLPKRNTTHDVEPPNARDWFSTYATRLSIISDHDTIPASGSHDSNYFNSKDSYLVL